MSDDQRTKILRSIKEIISNIESNIGSASTSCDPTLSIGSAGSCATLNKISESLLQLRKQTDKLISKTESRLGR